MPFDGTDFRPYSGEPEHKPRRLRDVKDMAVLAIALATALIVAACALADPHPSGPSLPPWAHYDGVAQFIQS